MESKLYIHVNGMENFWSYVKRRLAKFSDYTWTSSYYILRNASFGIIVSTKIYLTSFANSKMLWSGSLIFYLEEKIKKTFGSRPSSLENFGNNLKQILVPVIVPELALLKM